MLEACLTDDQLPADSDHAPVRPWWSFGKVAIAAAALALVRDKKLELDRLVAGQRYSLRQLLGHSAGLREYGALPEYHRAVAAGDPPWSEEELLRRTRSDELVSPPGERFAYSNVGYLLVNRLIARASGHPAQQVIDDLIFEPLGISGVRWAKTPQDFAAGAWDGAQSYHPAWVYHGLLMGTPLQAALFLRRLLTSDLLPASLLDAMLAGRELDVSLGDRPFDSASYGLGVMLPTCPLGRLQGHSGGGPGSGCAVFHLPDLTPARTVAVFAPVEDAALIERRMLELAAA
jgi:D-alanyl-D-alanine carboxypeptidase